MHATTHARKTVYVFWPKDTTSFKRRGVEIPLETYVALHICGSSAFVEVDFIAGFFAAFTSSVLRPTPLSRSFDLRLAGRRIRFHESLRERQRQKQAKPGLRFPTGAERRHQSSRMYRFLLVAAVVPLTRGDYSYDYTDAPTAAPTAETMSPTASMAPTRADTYAPTRMTEAPSYAPTTNTYSPTLGSCPPLSDPPPARPRRPSPSLLRKLKRTTLSGAIDADRLGIV